jgi:hypothetical protein
MVDLGLKTLLYDKVRFLITVSGVAFAVTLVLVQVGLFVGLLDNSSSVQPVRRRRDQDLPRRARPVDTRVLIVKVALNEPVPLKLGQRVEVEVGR